MTIVVLGIDLGKNVCSLAGLDETGAVVLRRRMKREGVIDFVAKMPALIVAMEACCGAHHLGRVLAGKGHTIRLMSPEYVSPYVKANKNDDHDAAAIAEAATRPTMRFVPVKSEEQSDIQSLHRARSRLVSERTALINYLRALLLERGIVVAQGRRKLEDTLGVFADEDDGRLGPWQEVVDAAVGMAVDDAGDDVREVGLGVDAVEFAGLDARGDDSPVLGAAVGAGEERILPCQVPGVGWSARRCCCPTRRGRRRGTGSAPASARAHSGSPRPAWSSG